MAEKHTFPQSGDSDYADDFGQMIGGSNQVGYVDRGMAFTVDDVANEVDITTGVCFVRTDTTISAISETRLNVGAVVQLPTTTKSLIDNDINYVYVDPALNSDDSPTFETVTDTNNAGSNWLRIGEVDMNDDPPTETLLNRSPSGSFRNIEIDESDLEFTSNSEQQITDVKRIEADIGGLEIDGSVTFENFAEFLLGIRSDKVEFTDTSGNSVTWTIRETNNGNMIFEHGVSDEMVLEKDGDLLIGGALTENASL